MSSYVISVQSMQSHHIPGAVALQRACFPAPFPEELLWQASHLQKHIEVFPEGQFVAIEDNGLVIASASSCKISEKTWLKHGNWDNTVGGPYIENHDLNGTTLYGLDISVHPNYRGQGIAKRLYESRLELVKDQRLTRYGTACRLPGCRDWLAEHPGLAPQDYCLAVLSQQVSDQTLTPLLRIGLTYMDTIENYMEDEESMNVAALLEWKNIE